MEAILFCVGIFLKNVAFPKTGVVSQFANGRKRAFSARQVLEMWSDRAGIVCKRLGKINEERGESHKRISVSDQQESTFNVGSTCGLLGTCVLMPI